MTEQEIKSLHGRYFTAEICFKDVSGRISVSDNGILYLCHDCEELSTALLGIEKFDYKYTWSVDMLALDEQCVQNLKILPSPLEYHELFKLILERRESTWDVDGNYSVIPKDVVSKIAKLIDGIKILGK